MWIMGCFNVSTLWGVIISTFYNDKAVMEVNNFGSKVENINEENREVRYNFLLLFEIYLFSHLF